MGAKGQPKTGGRKKGTPNRRPKQVTEFYDNFANIVEDQLDKLPAALEKIRQVSPPEYVKAVTNLAKIVLPNRVDASITGRVQTKTIEDKLDELAGQV